MIRSIGWFTCFMIILNSNAQFAHSPSGPKKPIKNAEITISSQFESDSYGLKSNFTNSLLFGEYLTNEFKTKTQSGLKDLNRFGAQYQSCFGIKVHSNSLLGIPVSFWRIKIKDRLHYGQQFTEDLFNLIFFGNSPYKGQTLTLDNSKQYQYKFQQFSLSGGWANDQWKLETSLSFYKGQNYTSGIFNKARILTAETGDSIDMDLDISLSNIKGSTFDFSGIGGGIDIKLNGFINNQFIIELKLEDLGQIRWNKPDINISKMGTNSFDGIYIHDVFSSVSSASNELILEDSIYSSLGITNDTNSAVTSFLPAHISIKGGIMKNKLTLEAGLHYWLNASHSPALFSNIKFKINADFQLKARISLMGYGSYNFGLGAKYTIADKIHLMVNSHKMLGIVMPNNFSGQALMFALGIDLY